MSEPLEQDVSDEELIAAIRERRTSALRSLYDRHAPWLAVRLSRRCADPSVVEEVLQDTFLAVWNGAGRYRADGEVAAWIWGIAIRRLIDRLRHRRSPSPLPVQPEPSAEELVLLGVEHGRLGPALDRLSPELRAVIQATALDGLTTREAGRFLGIPQGTVKSRLVRARQELREALA